MGRQWSANRESPGFRRGECQWQDTRPRFASIVSFHSHRNLQDLNLRPLPLSVKRRIPPRPRFRMPPSIPGQRCPPASSVPRRCILQQRGRFAPARPSICCILHRRPQIFHLQKLISASIFDVLFLLSLRCAPFFAAPRQNAQSTGSPFSGFSNGRTRHTVSLRNKLYGGCRLFQEGYPHVRRRPPRSAAM